MRGWKMVLRALGPLLALVGGALLVSGPVVRWATVAADRTAFAAALDVPQSALRIVYEESTGNYTWLQGGQHGDVVVVIGLVVFAIGIITLRRVSIPRGVVLGVLGLLAGWLALANAPDLAALRNDAITVAAPSAFAAEKDPEVLRPIFEVSRGPSMTATAVGALLATIAAAVVVVTAVVAPHEALDWVPWARFGRSRSEGGGPR